MADPTVVMKKVGYPGFSSDPIQIQQTPNKKKLNVQRVDKAAEDFEAMFLTQMMQPMFEGIPTDGMFGGGSSEEVYRSFLLDEYGRLMARAGGIGIADHVRKELLKLQEVQ
jgi:Rod binding domain-containing protein